MTSLQREVAPVEMTTKLTRPWSLSAAVRPTEAARLLVPTTAPIAPVYQAQAQAELILAPTAAGSKGISGFPVKNVQHNGGMDVRGVPPRSRPV